MKCLFSKSTVKCCICLDEKRNYIKCKKCKSSFVCVDCLNGLMERGLASKCPICQQLGWKENKIRSNIVVPSQINVSTNIKVKDDIKIDYCCYIKTFFRTLSFYTIILLFMYMIGLFLMSNFIKPEFSDLNIVTWVPLIIGLFSTILTLCVCSCCCKDCFKCKYVIDLLMFPIRVNNM